MNAPTVKVAIRCRWTGAVLFEADVDASIDEGLHLRAALEIAVGKRADLRGAYLRDADLRGADLRGADLGGAYLGGAYLRGADLRGADLRGADLRGAKHGDCLLIGDRPILILGPLGSRSDYLTVYVTDAGVIIRAGCFFGTLAEFEAAVAETHGDSIHGREYRAAVAMIRAHAELWTPAEGSAAA